MTIGFSHQRTLSNWNSMDDEFVVMKDDIPYTGWIDDGHNEINADFIGGNIMLGITKENYYGQDKNEYNPNAGRYLVVRNTRTLIVVEVNTKRVISEHYFDEKGVNREVVYFKPKDPETKKVIEGLPDVSYPYKPSFNVHGFDAAEGQAYRVHKEDDSEDTVLRVADVDLVCLFNRALQVRKTIELVSGDTDKLANKKKISTMKLIDGEAEKNVSSDSDDEKYLNVFGEKKVTNQESNKSMNSVEKIGALHKDINRDFYLRYLDWLMRMLYTGELTAAERASNGQFDKILKEDNKIELSESSINIYMHLLRQYKGAKNQNDACMLIYLVKTIEKHLESLVAI